MKKAFLSIFFLFCLIFNVFSQFEVGFKVGLNSYDLAGSNIKSLFEKDKFNLTVHEADYGHHLGIYTRVQIAGFFIEPAFLFNSNVVTYKFEEYTESGVVNVFKDERYNNIDIPVLLGYKLGFLRIQAGPVCHLFINSTSELFSINDYEQNFKKATYGYRAGVGLDIWKFRFDINHEGSFDRYSDFITIKGNNYTFSKNPSRMLFTLGYKF